MPAETLKCPTCGASASSLDSKCGHCGAILATVACPSCFGMIFQGAEFCSHCGSRVARIEEEVPTQCKCPRCAEQLNRARIGNTEMMECRKCQGLWVDNKTVQRIYAEKEQQAAVLGMALNLPETIARNLEVVRYLPCPICGNMMNRVNFANCSHVIVDVCRNHGTWFDKDELRQIVEFIRSGGLDRARMQENYNLTFDRTVAQYRSDLIHSAPLPRQVSSNSWAEDLPVQLISVIIQLIFDLFI